MLPVRGSSIESPALSDLEDAASREDLLVRDWTVPWHAHCVPVAMALAMTGIWLAGVPRAHPQVWYLSWTQLATGQLLPVIAYMFAHLSLLHLALNALALVVLGGPLVACFGSPPISWARFVYLYLGAGIGGGLAFVLAHENPTPVVGASGAIFGVLGALARVHPATGTLVPVGSRRTWLMTKFFIGNHAVLFAIAAVIAVLSGQAQSLAWEAHLGGLLFGFFAAPLFLDRSADPVRS